MVNKFLPILLWYKEAWFGLFFTPIPHQIFLLKVHDLSFGFPMISQEVSNLDEACYLFSSFLGDIQA
jgi:hypothetical protein